MTRSVVITGVGAVTPLGVGARTLHERWSAGQSGIEDGFGRASEFEPKEHLSTKEVRRSDRFTSSRSRLPRRRSRTPAGTATRPTTRTASPR